MQSRGMDKNNGETVLKQTKLMLDGEQFFILWNLFKHFQVDFFFYYDETKTSVIEEKIQGSSLCHLSKSKQVISNNEISNAIDNWAAICWAELGIQILNLNFV